MEEQEVLKEVKEQGQLQEASITIPINLYNLFVGVLERSPEYHAMQMNQWVGQQVQRQQESSKLEEIKLDREVGAPRGK